MSYKFCKKSGCTNLTNNHIIFCDEHIPIDCHACIRIKVVKPNHRIRVSITDRGLCRTCFNRAEHYVSTGQTSWDKLIDKGLANRI